jgi:hypothetical protein
MADIALMHHLLIALGIGLLIGAERSGAKPSARRLRGCAPLPSPALWVAAAL